LGIHHHKGADIVTLHEPRRHFERIAGPATVDAEALGMQYGKTFHETSCHVTVAAGRMGQCLCRIAQMGVAIVPGGEVAGKCEVYGEVGYRRKRLDLDNVLYLGKILFSYD
jgi:hypothetical protein